VTPTAVYLEIGAKRVFACAYDFPGLCRAGRDEETALAALAEAVPRYAAVARQAHSREPSDVFDVVERLKGSATTDFGAPGAIPAGDSQPLELNEVKRIVALLEASWKILDDVVGGAPAELTKGPRGGGRDRDKIADHVLGAEVAYVSKLGVRGRQQPALADRQAIADHRATIVEALQANAATAWPRRYAARRIAWHVLDHAWEIQNRTPR
jgi:hypothetical protein